MSDPSQPSPTKPIVEQQHAASGHQDGDRYIPFEKPAADPNSEGHYDRKTTAKFFGEITRLLKDFNFWLVLGTWILAGVGIFTLRDSSDSLARSMRAWTGPSIASIDGPVTAGQAATIKVVIVNTGREPALDFTWILSHLTVDGGKDGPGTKFEHDLQGFVADCKKTTAQTDAQVLYPTTGLGTGFAFTSTFDKSLITPKVVSGDTSLVAVGCLAYVTSGQTRHSTFCYFYNARVSKPESLSLCNNGSYAD